MNEFKEGDIVILKGQSEVIFTVVGIHGDNITVISIQKGNGYLNFTANKNAFQKSI